jgi:hypothetical protein
MKSIISALTMVCCVTFLCMAIFSGFGINPAYAGANCTDKPDHPRCVDGGGGGGGEDPPTANPAFALVGTSTVYLMDIDGSNFR